jgi:hypothetical protein
MSGGGSAPSNTTSTTTTELPQWAQPYSQQLLNRGVDMSNQSMPVYTGQRSAGLNSLQGRGMDMVVSRAVNGSNDVNAGSQALQSTLSGQYLGRDTGTNQYMGTQPTGQNAYMGDNPYLQGAIDKAAGDITRNYNGAVNATDATMARAGVFGGSAWQQAQEANSHNLASSLADSATAMRMQNYNQSAGLAENALGRQQQNWQTNAALADAGLARNQAAFEGERGRQMAALQPALAYGNQAYTDASQLQNAGEIQYGADQQQLSDAMAQWNEQAQSPYKQLDVLGNTIRAAVGGGSSVSQTAPGANPYAQAAGGAAALYSIFGK